MDAYQHLENLFAKWMKVENAVGVSSGTAALHLALESLRLPLGSRVIVPDFTMIACARAVTLAGLEPVFVDCRTDLQMDPDLVDEAARRSDARAIMAVHIYGRRCNMYRLSAIAAARNMHLIEDMSEIHGFPPWPATDAACWSFYRNKVIGGEEGGMITFKNPLRAGLARKLRSLGFTDDHDFHHVPRGHNYRLSNAHALLILGSLRDYPKNIHRRRRIEGVYNGATPKEWRLSIRSVPWVYDLRIPGLSVTDQDRIIRALRERGIEARHGFKPMSEQPEYYNGSRGHSPEARRASREVLYLPIRPDMTDDQARSYVQELKRVALPTRDPAAESVPAGDSLPPDRDGPR